MSPTIDGITYANLGNIQANADKSYQYLLARLLLGNMTISQNRSTLRQSSNFHLLPPQLQAARPSPAFNAYLASSGLGCTGARFIQKTIADNRTFYKDVLSEFSNYFLQTHRDSHTAAFVFLYRVLERLSFSIPLLYSSTQSDYFGTFNQLKEFFSNDLQGELGLFKVFLNQGKFIDSLVLDFVYDLNFASSNGHAPKYFELARSMKAQYVSADATINKIEIKFREVPEMLKSIRNRFFHFRTGDGQKNIRLEDVWDTDEFFKNVNPIFASFLAFVVLTSIAKKYK
jgi:hypothetical protein